jgi:hypothetical protein
MEDFAMPPSEAPPAEAAPEGDFTMVGEAPPAEAAPEMLGDVNETADMGFASGGADMGFASGGADMGFAGGAPEGGEMDAFAAPPAEDETPIILGAPPAEEPETVADEEEPIPAINPSIMQKWNEEWQVTLSERKDEENAKKAEMVETSRATLEKFQSDREAKREAKMAKNREDEQAKLEAIEADLENDNSWQRACKMVELSHDGAHEGEDVKRMRDVLILLKNEPARASAVGA